MSGISQTGSDSSLANVGHAQGTPIGSVNQCLPLSSNAAEPSVELQSTPRSASGAIACSPVAQDEPRKPFP